jgi:hypothetical protein
VLNLHATAVDAGSSEVPFIVHWLPLGIIAPLDQLRLRNIQHCHSGRHRIADHVTVPVPYRHPAVDHTDRPDQDLNVYSCPYFLGALRRKRQVVGLQSGSRVFAPFYLHSLPASARLHPFPSTPLRLSRTARI